MILAKVCGWAESSWLFVLRGKGAERSESQENTWLKSQWLAQLHTKKKTHKEEGVAGTTVNGGPEDRPPKGSAQAARPDCSPTPCAWSLGGRHRPRTVSIPAQLSWRIWSASRPRRLIKMQNDATQRPNFECLPCSKGNGLFPNGLQGVMRGSWLSVTCNLRPWHMEVKGSQISVTWGTGGGWEFDEDGWSQHTIVWQCRGRGEREKGKGISERGTLTWPWVVGSAEGEMV